jgi:hypothetical protein
VSRVIFLVASAVSTKKSSSPTEISHYFILKFYGKNTLYIQLYVLVGPRTIYVYYVYESG